MFLVRDLNNRLYRAIKDLDLGIPLTLMKTKRLEATNMALRFVGAPQVENLDSRARVLRAVVSLEEAS
tara:strand:+ start:19407 stop:19610 length:204 start_codon:yes stop_codon:yes gene_type:complete